MQHARSTLTRPRVERHIGRDDGPTKTLLYGAWSLGGTPTRVLAVRADTPTNVTVLTEGSSLTGFIYDHPWVPVQMWGRQPG